MVRTDPNSYEKHELANRCYEFVKLLMEIETAFQTWQGGRRIERLVGLRSAELDERVSKLTGAFSGLADEKSGWMDGEQLSIPLHPRHDLKDAGVIVVTITRHDDGNTGRFEATIPVLLNQRPLIFTFD